MYYLLWLDDSRASAADRVRKAVHVYQDRYGATPSVVLVNERDKADVDGVRVEARDHVAVANYWLGPVASSKL